MEIREVKIDPRSTIATVTLEISFSELLEFGQIRLAGTLDGIRDAIRNAPK